MHGKANEAGVDVKKWIYVQRYQLLLAYIRILLLLLFEDGRLPVPDPAVSVAPTEREHLPVTSFPHKYVLPVLAVRPTAKNSGSAPPGNFIAQKSNSSCSDREMICGWVSSFKVLHNSWKGSWHGCLCPHLYSISGALFTFSLLLLHSEAAAEVTETKGQSKWLTASLLTITCLLLLQSEAAAEKDHTLNELRETNEVHYYYWMPSLFSHSKA
eukprot:1143847-Pelagomonas_calceolata.AAC.3